jgi:hypothetical protein
MIIEASFGETGPPNPTAFLSLLGRVLPLQVDADVQGAMQMRTTVIHQRHSR